MTELLAVIDATADDLAPRMQALRQRLSPDGNIVSATGRQKTLDVFGEPLTPRQVVARICDDVKEHGLSAVLDYGLRIDGANISAETVRVSTAELAAAHAAADADFLASIRRIRDRIHEFQTAILHHDKELVRADGTRLQQRYSPLRRVGVCVPGGAAAYPSTVLMTAVPALAAGVREVAVVAPPTDFGANNPDVLATCHELGIQEVYRVGGAQAVAALAYGVERIAAVDKIVGPGNLFVALAKGRVYGTVDIDSIAGPSEVVVIGDATTSPAACAADLLAQAEHCPGASILITWDRELLQRTLQALVDQLSRLERADVTRESLRDFGAAILVADENQAVEITNQLAPEHLHIASNQPRRLAERIHNAGATFLGPFTPVAVGDYVAGPSHVLPTGGTARWASGLSANSFLRGSSVIEFTSEGLAGVADDLERIARREQLTAHWESVSIRLALQQPRQR